MDPSCKLLKDKKLENNKVRNEFNASHFFLRPLVGILSYQYIIMVCSGCHLNIKPRHIRILEYANFFIIIDMLCVW